MDRRSTSNPVEINDEPSFYVEPECCLLCGIPEDIAPELFETGDQHCSVKRQPACQAEIDKVVHAMWASEVECIRYRGNDELLLARLAEAGMTGQTDHPSAVRRSLILRDRVNFTITSDSRLTGSVQVIAKAFRHDRKMSGDKVLPGIFGPTSVLFSWFRWRFHVIRFAKGAEQGAFTAQLISVGALQGLAWFVDHWLREQGVSDIWWIATDNEKSAGRPTPM